jgi:hypothetical protein
MTPLTILLCLALLGVPPQDTPGWKAKRVAIVVQHSGANMTLGAAFVSMVQRVLALRPAKSEAGIVGFDRDFEQLEGNHFRRRAVVLEPFSTDSEELSGAVKDMVFHGPSPIWDAVMIALGDGKPETTPDRILLLTNGMDNASKTTFDDLETAARKTGVPVISIYFPEQPTGGGDTRLKKLTKASGGKFIDTRLPNSWESIVASLQ